MMASDTTLEMGGLENPIPVNIHDENSNDEASTGIADNQENTPLRLKREVSVDSHFSQTYDICVWLDNHHIFEMMERRTSHADPQLVGILQFWKRRIGRYKARLCSKTEGSDDKKLLDVRLILKWAEELNQSDTSTSNKDEVDCIISFLQGSDLLKSSSLVDKKTFCKAVKEHLLLDIGEDDESIEIQKFKDGLLMFAYAEEFRWWPPKPFSFVMSIIHLSIFLHVRYNTTMAKDNTKLPPVCSNLILNPYTPHEAWRFLTYSFVHFDTVHLITNIFGVFISGMFLEYTNKWWRVAPVFYAGVVFAGIIITAINPTALVGMSAGVYALMAASLADLALNWSDGKLVLRQRFSNRSQTVAVPVNKLPKKFPTWFKLRQIRCLIPILWIVVDVAYSLYTMITVCNERFCDTSYLAHFIGILTGISAGFLWLKNRRFKKWVILTKRYLRYILAGVIIAFLIALLAQISATSSDCLSGGGRTCQFYGKEKCCLQALRTELGSCCMFYLYNRTKH